MSGLACLVFFVAGAAALAFETLWFHQATLAFGSSVWASSLVLSAFMAGLALGSFGAARLADVPRRPARAYALLELAIGVSGAALVLALPALGPGLAPLLGPLLDRPWLANPLRLALAFALLLVPATAMGATLPLFVRALLARDPNYGGVLGRLYGWNTLGAVAGVVGTTWLGIGALGMRGMAVAAAALSALAAAGALWLARHQPAAPQRGPTAPGPLGLLARAPLPAAAAFGAGFALLALEVIWFRLLENYIVGTTRGFGLMLATVLCAIGSGALVAAAGLRRRPDAWRWGAPLAFAAGVATVASYAGLAPVLDGLFQARTQQALPALAFSAALVFPVSFLSGLLFPCVGAALEARAPSGAQATGALGFANTIGAALGSLCAGFALLPGLGSERSLLGLALLYGAVGAALLPACRSRAVAGVAAVALGAAVLLFPSGLLERAYLSPRQPTQSPVDALRFLGYRESPTETLAWFEERMFGRPYAHVLVTNGFAMSSTRWSARRYMKLFVRLPAALHPRLERALLISYGVGSTARALVETPSLGEIDVVDISRDILETSRMLHGERDPLADPRVRVHVEDGRYFLQVGQRDYDLVTAEPPPPILRGIHSLYTREYFQLIRANLREGGIATYWLPLHSLPEPATRAVLGAFCDVFADCTLWSGWGYDLMLMGTRGARGPVSEAHFAAAWGQPEAAAELQALGLERPEQLGALFVAGPDALRGFAAPVPPLVDDFPQRILGPVPDHRLVDAMPPLYQELRNPPDAMRRFLESRFVAAHWPPALRRRSLPYFGVQRLVNEIACCPSRVVPEVTAHAILANYEVSTPVLWAFGSDADKLRIARSLDAPARERPDVRLHLAIGALAAGDPARALARLGRGEGLATALRPHATRLRLYALAALGRRAEATALARAETAALGEGMQREQRLRLLGQAFGLDLADLAR